MEPADLAALFDHLEKRLRELVSERDGLNRRLAESETDREHLRTHVRQQADYIKKLQKKQEALQNNFQKQHNIAKLVHSMGADAKETAELKGKIEAYIQDIDKCIAYLSQS